MDNDGIGKTNVVRSADVDVKTSEMIAYTAGGFANNFVFTGVLSFLMVFWTDTLMIPAGLCGTFMMLCRLWDAINDPIIGSMADRTRSKMGQYRPWIAFSFAPMLILFVMEFTKLPNATQTGQIVYSFVVYFLLVLATTCVMIPHYSLSSTLTTNQAARGKLVGTRLAGEHAGAILTSAIFFPMIMLLGKGDMAKGFQLTALVLAIIAIPFYFWCIKGTKEKAVLPMPPKTPLSTMFKALKGNSPFWILFICFICWGISGGIIGVKVYFFKYNLGNEGGFATNMAIWFCGMAAASFIIRFMYKNLKNKRVIPQVGFAGATVILIILGAFPFTPETINMYHAITFVAGLFMGTGLAGIFAMVPDTTEFTQAKHGLRTAGFLAAFVNFANKLGTALFTAVVGWTMTAMNYVPNAEVQTAEISSLFNYFLHFGSAIAMLVALITLSFYKLDRDTFNKIVDDLDKESAEG